jgi:hypothetical protein
MSGQRAEGKNLVAAYVSAQLLAGILIWMEENPGKTKTDFLILAIIEKLEREGFPINRTEAFKDGRFRAPVSPQAEANVNYLRRARAKGKGGK